MPRQACLPKEYFGKHGDINMEDIFTALLTGQPELYLILCAILYGLKQLIPLGKKNIEIKQSTLDCLMRIETNTKEGTIATQENTRAIKSLEGKVASLESRVASKDDIINVLLKSPPGPPLLNGSGPINKQVTA